MTAHPRVGVRRAITTTGTVAPAAGPDAASLARLVDDLRVARRVLALRVSWSVRTYRRLAAAAVALAALATAGVVLVVASAAVDLAGPAGRSGIAALGLVGLVYAGMGRVGVPLLGARRRELAQDSNAAFYRAVDLPQNVVVLAHAVRGQVPAVVTQTAAAGVLAGVTAGVGPRALAVAAGMLAVPALWAVAAVGTTLQVAGRPTRGRRLGVTLPSVASLAVLLGWLLAPLGAALVGQGGAGAELGVRELAARAGSPLLVVACLAGSVVAAVVGGVLGRRSWARLARDSFVHPAGRSRSGVASGRPAVVGRAVRLAPVTVGLVRDWSQGWAGELAGRTYEALTASVGLLVGLRVGGVDLRSVSALLPEAGAAPVWPGVPSPDQAAAALFAALCGSVALGLASTAQSRAGVRARVPSLRAAWEGGAGENALAAAGLLGAAVPGLAAMPLLVALAVLTGGSPLEAVTWPLAAAAACVLADLLVAPPVQADGTVADDDTLSSLATVGLLIPLGLSAFLRGPALVPLLVVPALMIGAHLCLRRRILLLPSSSAGSASGTTGQPQS